MGMSDANFTSTGLPLESFSIVQLIVFLQASKYTSDVSSACFPLESFLRPVVSLTLRWQLRVHATVTARVACRVAFTSA